MNGVLAICLRMESSLVCITVILELHGLPQLDAVSLYWFEDSFIHEERIVERQDTVPLSNQYSPRNRMLSSSLFARM